MQQPLAIMINMEVMRTKDLFDVEESRWYFTLETRKRLIGLHGLILGCGEIFGTINSDVSLEKLFV